MPNTIPSGARQGRAPRRARVARRTLALAAVTAVLPAIAASQALAGTQTSAGQTAAGIAARQTSAKAAGVESQAPLTSPRAKARSGR